MNVKIEVELNRPRWLRLPRTRWARVAAVAGAALVVAAPAAWASHNYTDVPPGLFSHAGVSALKDAGIADACNPVGPRYCPDQPATRGELAVYLHRGLGRAALAPYDRFQILNGLDQDISVLTVDVGGVPGGTAFVSLTAQVGSSITATAGCPCGVSWHVARDGGDADGGSAPAYTQNDTLAVSNQTGNRAGLDMASLAHVVAVPTGTTQTFRLKAQQWAGKGTVNGFGRLTAVVAPLGSTGGNVLGAMTRTLPTMVQPPRRGDPTVPALAASP